MGIIEILNFLFTNHMEIPKPKRAWNIETCKLSDSSTVTLHGGFLKWWYPQNTTKWSSLVGKPMVVGETHHFRVHPHIQTYISHVSPRVISSEKCRVESHGGPFGGFIADFGVLDLPMLGPVRSRAGLRWGKRWRYGDMIHPTVPGWYMLCNPSFPPEN